MRRARTGCLILLGTLAAGVFDVHAQTPLGSGFTYQGQLKQNGAPMNGTVNLRFSLWDAAGSGSPPAGGNQIGSAQQITNLPITDGLFTVTLNGSNQFGATAFNGQARFLQIDVCSDSSCTARTALGPRQPLTVAPYAAFAAAPWTQPVAGGSAIGYAAGNVGVGTQTPGTRLDVVSGSLGDGITLRASLPNDPGIHLVDGSTERGTLGLALQAGNWSTNAAPGDIVLRATTGKLLLQNGALGAVLAIASNNVGIGT